MPQLPGVYQAKKKNGTIYYRSSLTYRAKHISLGSYGTPESAHEAYRSRNRSLSLGFRSFIRKMGLSDKLSG